MAEPSDPMCPLAPEGDTEQAYDNYLQALENYNKWAKDYEAICCNTLHTTNRGDPCDDSCPAQ